jgi:hypothetical protein
VACRSLLATCSERSLSTSPDLANQSSPRMAFVTISGFPSSGKSTFVAKLQADFERRIAASPSPCNLSVTVVGDELGLVGREVYSGEVAIPHDLCMLSQAGLAADV